MFRVAAKHLLAIPKVKTRSIRACRVYMLIGSIDTVFVRSHWYEQKVGVLDIERWVSWISLWISGLQAGRGSSVDHPVEVALPLCSAPANPLIPWSSLPGRCTKARQSNHTFTGISKEHEKEYRSCSIYPHNDYTSKYEYGALLVTVILAAAYFLQRCHY